MKKRNRLCWAAYGVLAMATLAIAGAWSAGLLLIHPAQRAIGAPPDDLPIQPVIFASNSGSLIHGWFMAGTAGHGAVLLLHGVRANRLSMLDRARLLRTAGYSVLLIDFQASGESQGQAISFGYRESQDAQAAVEQLRRLAPHERIGIIATSMGAAAVLLAEPAIKVDAMVLEQVYPTIEQALNDRLALHAGAMGRWLAPALLATLRPHLGISAAELRPIDKIPYITAPKLLIAGDHDRHTRMDESLSIFTAAAKPKQLWIVHGAEHVDLYRHAGNDYAVHVLAFLDAWLRQRK
ncbi:alpha/beta hydrolase [Dyella silvatica]|uniref:alpha/beta hydrolase n=1 Tax=Dyella silvatica TaxID=2992128 RepID=UPI0022521F53|nr:alpha/beta fold hydrolase [Dyella silvatica]